jgi:3-isopropylmalate/(R)-2-methylmalate dehydratase small subunit
MTAKQFVGKQFVGKTWKFGANINTEVLCPQEAFFLPPVEQIPYLFKAIRPDWYQLAGRGDIIVAGRNFGQGSGRPSAEAFRLLGISCLLADSINGLFFRNSVNYGFWSLECPGVHDAFDEGDVAEVDLSTFVVTNKRTGAKLQAKPFPKELIEMVEAGGLFAQLEATGYLAPLPPKPDKTAAQQKKAV